MEVRPLRLGLLLVASSTGQDHVPLEMTDVGDHYFRVVVPQPVCPQDPQVNVVHAVEVVQMVL